MLWSYKTFVNVPKKVECKNASALLEKQTCDMYITAGVQLAHIADYIRVRAANTYGGWVFDLDVYFLRNLPLKNKFSFSALPTLAFPPKKPRWKTCRWPDWDGKCVIEFPSAMKLPKASDFGQELENRMKRRLDMLKPISWNVFIHLGRDLIEKYNLQQYVYPPLYFAPLPCWKRAINWPLQANKFERSERYISCILDSKKDILRTSYTVHTFFKSSSPHMKDAVKATPTVEPGSLMNDILEKINSINKP